MNGIVGTRVDSQGHSRFGALLRKDDWWVIWIGLGLVILAVALVQAGSSLKWLAVAPTKWSHWSGTQAQLSAHALQYLLLFGIAVNALRQRVLRFLPAFAAVFVVSLLLYTLRQWDQAVHYNLEAPLVRYMPAVAAGTSAHPLRN